MRDIEGRKKDLLFEQMPQTALCTKVIISLFAVSGALRAFGQRRKRTLTTSQLVVQLANSCIWR
jgi:hypothetical protein